MIPYIQINLPTYELMAVIGLAASFSFLRLRNRSFGYSRRQLQQMFAAVVAGMLIGSRIFYVLSVLPELIKKGLTAGILAEHLLSGGFVFYGGLLGAVTGVVLYCRIKKLDCRQTLNFAVPAMPLFHMFGRIGCFLAGCCYGIEVSWGIPYLGARRFPVQLLEAVLEFLLAVWLLSYEDKRKVQAEGEQTEYCLLERYMAAYAVLRFGLEFLRGDAARGIWGPCSVSQWISIFLLAYLGISWWRRKRRKGNE